MFNFYINECDFVIKENQFSFNYVFRSKNLEQNN